MSESKVKGSKGTETGMGSQFLDWTPGDPGRQCWPGALGPGQAMTIVKEENAKLVEELQVCENGLFFQPFWTEDADN